MHSARSSSVLMRRASSSISLRVLSAANMSLCAARPASTSSTLTVTIQDTRVTQTTMQLDVTFQIMNLGPTLNKQIFGIAREMANFLSRVKGDKMHYIENLHLCPTMTQ